MSGCNLWLAHCLDPSSSSNQDHSPVRRKQKGFVRKTKGKENKMRISAWDKWWWSRVDDFDPRAPLAGQFQSADQLDVARPMHHVRQRLEYHRKFAHWDRLPSPLQSHALLCRPKSNGFFGGVGWAWQPLSLQSPGCQVETRTPGGCI